MANYGQLSLFNATEAAEMQALGQVRWAEIVQITWPDATATPPGPGVVNYAWWQLDQDPGYTSTVTPWLDSRPLVVAFAPNDPDSADLSHTLVSTAAIGDDVVTFRFSNKNQVFAKLCYQHRGGVRVEVFRHYPQLDSGAGVTKSVWWGHLNTPDADAVNTDWVTVTASNGFRSSQNIVPSTAHGNCEWPFPRPELPIIQKTSEFTPCDYDPANGRGLNDPATSQPFPTCPNHNPTNCQERWGATLWRQKYGGMTTAVENIAFGEDGRGISRTQGSQTASDTPAQVIYGQIRATGLYLLDFRKEFHPDDGSQDQGTLLTLPEVSLGRVKSITEVKVADKDMPRPDGMGLIVKLGAQDQTNTGFTTNGIGYNRRAYFRADLNPVDPAQYNRANIAGTALVEGRDEIAIYTNQTTYTRGYTNLRAWGALDLLINRWYGWRLDPDRLVMDDFIHLDGLGSLFNCVVAGRTIQQQVQDIAAAGGWYLPFWYDGKVRWTAQEELDFLATDVPTFTDTGATPNIITDEDTGDSRLTFGYASDDRLPNKLSVVFNDSGVDWKERTIFVENETAQQAIGTLNGDDTMRAISVPFSAYGLTSETEAVNAGTAVLAIGKYGDGGLNNNCACRMELWDDDPDAVNLHPNKVFKLVSPKLSTIPYKDREGNAFTHFRVTRLEWMPDGRIVVNAVAYKEVEAIQPIQLCPSHPTPTPPYRAIRFDSVGGSVLWIRSFLDSFDPFPTENTIYLQVYLESEMGTGLPSEAQTFVTWGIFGTAYWVGSYTVADTPYLALRCDGVTYHTGSTLDVGRWYSIAVTMASDGTRKVYLDGVLDITQTGTAPDTSGEWYTLIFGRVGILAGKQLDGRIAGIKVFDSVHDSMRIGKEKGAYTPCDATGIWANWTCHNFPDSVIGSGTGDVFDYSANCRDAGYEAGGVLSEADGPSIPFWCRSSDISSGGTTITQTASPSRLIFIDRLWRATDFNRAKPGVYVALAPIDFTQVWTSAAIYRDAGLGYSSLATITTQATLGDASTVLAGTSGGGETVDITLDKPGATLPSYTAPEVAAGAGKVYLGGEIFQYRTATQLTTTPNVWRLSNLSNRGAHCTTAAMATHAIGDDFVVLDDAVVWVPVELSEVGQTRQYKPVTGGRTLAQTTAQGFTLTAPNFQITTPADYAITFESSLNALRHKWTPILPDGCLILENLRYEIRLSPGTAPVWEGRASEWLEPVTGSATRTYCLRALTDYDTGADVCEAITFSATTSLLIDDTDGEDLYDELASGDVDDFLEDA